MYSNSDIVPEEYQVELDRLKNASTVIFWRVGYIAWDVIERNKKEKRHVSKDDCDRATGVFYGKAARTIREYRTLYRFYTDLGVLENYSKYDQLSDDHFRTAAKYVDPVHCLDWCMEKFDTLNRPATVDEMEAEFGEGMPDTSLAEPIVPSEEEVHEFFEEEDISGDPVRHRRSRFVISAIANCTVLMHNLNQLPLPVERLTQFLDYLHEIEEEISKLKVVD